jgi:undecaprenol kinase
MKTWFKSFLHAVQGWKNFFGKERNAQIQLASLILVVACGLWLEIKNFEWLVIVLISGLVLSLEMTNSALETTLNLLHPDVHPLVKKAKDLMAGAVLIVSMAAIVVALIIFTPYLTTLFAQ